MISIIIPVFNERNYIETCLRAVFAAPYEKQVIVVDDASTDGTREELIRIRDDFGFTLLLHERNKGKGTAIKTAQSCVVGNVVIIQDGDLEYDPMDYEIVLQPILDGKKKVVYGSRNLKKENKRYSALFYLGGRFVTAVTNLLYGLDLTDVNTCYKGFRADIFKAIPLSESRFNFCEEITAKLVRSGYEISEVPINYYPRTVEQGKKLGVKDGIRSILTLFRYRLWRNKRNGSEKVI